MTQLHVNNEKESQKTVLTWNECGIIVVNLEMWHTHTHTSLPLSSFVMWDIVSHKKMQVLFGSLETFAQREDFRLRCACVWFVNRIRMQRGCEVTLFCMFFPFCQIRKKRRGKNTHTHTLKRIGLVWFGLVWFLFWYGLTLCCSAKEIHVSIEPGNFLSMTYYLEYLESLFIPIMFWFKVKRITIKCIERMFSIYFVFCSTLSLKWIMTMMMMSSFYIT